MASHKPTTLRPQRRRLVHAAMDAYLGWRDECNAVRDSYRGWRDAGEADAAFAFQTYAAALQREQRASAVYAALIQRVGLLLGPGRELRTGPAVRSQEAHR
jgi:hypothetical protein